MFAGTHLGLWKNNSGWGITRDIQEETELCGLTSRTGEITVIVPPSVHIAMGIIIPTLRPPTVAGGNGSLQSQEKNFRVIYMRKV